MEKSTGVPPYIREAARKRLQETLEEQRISLDKISREERPMDAEDKPDRKIAYIQKHVGVSKDIASAIANYDDPRNLPISEEKKSKAESMQGATLDYLDICFADLCRAASRSVARVIFDDGSPQGTGFMISPDLFITNQHVISSEAMAHGMQIEFNYESDFRKNLQNVTRFKLAPEKFFHAVPSDTLDFAIVAIGNKVSGPLDAAQLGFLPLVDSEDKHIKGMFVNCIQHPGGSTKQLVVRENRLLARTDTTLIYGSDTENGSSGSPIFNDEWEVLALHHWGEPYRAVVEQPQGLPEAGNEGIRISAIVTYLKNFNGFKPHEAPLIAAALSYNFRFPSLMTAPVRPAPIGHQHNFPTDIKKNEAMPSSAITNVGNVQTFTIPLTISVQLGQLSAANTGPQVTQTDTPSAGEEAIRKFIPDPNYNNRRGYNPNFLGRKIPLPVLNEQQKQDAARNQLASPSADPFELKYYQFSVVMNGKRRMAFFTAVNIDGASVISIKRETGQVTRGPESVGAESAEARETWYDDNRIDDSEISEDNIYRDKLKMFQRGHLVKRTDPSWGTESKAFKGQSDTFHFTNCSPQHKDFNPKTTRWAGVENWITKTSNDADIRVSVFSGPVFTPDDPHLGYLQIPKAYWKVVAWMEEGELFSTAIIADQSDLIKNIGEEAIGSESLFDDIPAQLPEDYHVTIAEVESKTGLDFGILKDYDILGTGSAEALHDNGDGGAGVGNGRSPWRIFSYNDILKRK
ncbi:DNA/RNA non-specific endonuclease [Foetidibacter luteolus]|uniref:DNA/RNA non-specific endonuclease n=1 Tax=Foetidibacter luteolus TaxID=2608880 RepID=UPI00129B5BCB|nr:DNA/RNA non-specific endonuclease [Foetidibacter luteolus]